MTYNPQFIDEKIDFKKLNKVKWLAQVSELGPEPNFFFILKPTHLLKIKKKKA